MTAPQPVASQTSSASSGFAGLRAANGNATAGQFGDVLGQLMATLTQAAQASAASGDAQLQAAAGTAVTANPLGTQATTATTGTATNAAGAQGTAAAPSLPTAAALKTSLAGPLATVRKTIRQTVDDAAATTTPAQAVASAQPAPAILPQATQPAPEAAQSLTPETKPAADTPDTILPQTPGLALPGQPTLATPQATPEQTPSAQATATAGVQTGLPSAAAQVTGAVQEGAKRLAAQAPQTPAQGAVEAQPAGAHDKALAATPGLAPATTPQPAAIVVRASDFRAPAPITAGNAPLEAQSIAAQGTRIMAAAAGDGAADAGAGGDAGGGDRGEAAGDPALTAGFGVDTRRAEATGSFTQLVAASRATASANPPAVVQVAQPLLRAAQDGTKALTIDLQPAELGRIQVKLDFGKDGSVRAAISADRADTLALLKRDQGVLTDAFAGAGLSTDASGLSFSLGTGNGGQSGWQAGAQGQGQGQAGGQATGSAGAAAQTGGTQGGDAATPIVRTARPGGVDLSI